MSDPQLPPWHHPAPSAELMRRKVITRSVPSPITDAKGDGRSSDDGLLVVVSDLHLGGGGDNDGFAGSAQSFRFFFQAIVGEHWRLIGAGDMLDLIEDRHWAIELQHPQVLSWIHAARSFGHWIRGNHDYSAAGLPDHLDLAPGVRVLHGHQFDIWNHGKLKWIGDRIARLDGWLQHRGWQLSRKWLKVFRGVGHKRSIWKYMTEQKLHTLIMGHTHRPGHWRNGSLKLYNTGTWTGKPPYSYVTVNLTTKKVHLARW